MKPIFNRSMETTYKENSLNNTSFLKLSTTYIPTDRRTKSKHCRIKTDQLQHNNAESTISTSIDLKCKGNRTNKVNKKFSASQSCLKKMRSQKNVQCVTSNKPFSVHKTPQLHHKITLHRKIYTVQSLQKLRSGVSAMMNPQEAAEQHKNICQKIKQKNQYSRQNKLQSKLLDEYQQLTESLFDVIGNIRKNHEKQRKREKERQQKKQQKIVKRYENILQKNRNYSVLFNEIGKQINIEALIQQNKRNGKLKKNDD